MEILYDNKILLELLLAWWKVPAEQSAHSLNTLVSCVYMDGVEREISFPGCNSWRQSFDALKWHRGSRLKYCLSVEYMDRYTVVRWWLVGGCHPQTDQSSSRFVRERGNNNNITYIIISRATKIMTFNIEIWPKNWTEKLVKYDPKTLDLTFKLEIFT